MTSERWRCFVAAPLNEPMRRRLAASVDGWRAREDLAELRWTDPGSWHVTLVFLGSIGSERVGEVERSVAEVAERHAPMRLRTAGVGGFPSASRARVAWYGVSDPDLSLARLAEDLRRSLGLASSSPFRGHVTLARARREPVDLRRWMADAVPPEDELPVDRVDLMRSHLAGGPARYELLASAPIGVAAHV